MKAIRVYEYGSPEVLRLEEIADPVAGEGEVLIDVAGAGVNPIDWKILSGVKKAFILLPLPFTPGVEVAGTVVATGTGVTEFNVGDEVFGFINIVGGYATKALASVSKLAKIRRSKKVWEGMLAASWSSIQRNNLLSRNPPEDQASAGMIVM